MTGRLLGLLMAGGEGSRMARTRPQVPKALVRVGGVPLITRSLRRMQLAGITRAFVSVHHRSQEIIHELRTDPALVGIEIEFLVEEEPLGTIGSLAELTGTDHDVLVQNADLLSAIDLQALHATHRRRGADMTIATHLEHHRLQLGEVLSDGNGQVTEYREKPVKSYRISSGTYVVSPSCLRLCSRAVFTPFPDFVNFAIRSGRNVVEFPHDKAWIDVNDEHDLIAAERMLAADPVAFALPNLESEMPEDSR